MSGYVDIREVIKMAQLERVTIEKAIAEMLRVFEEETGCAIETITVRRERTVDDDGIIVSVLIGVSIS